MENILQKGISNNFVAIGFLIETAGFLAYNLYQNFSK
jgi:hypothetical protein